MLFLYQKRGDQEDGNEHEGRNVCLDDDSESQERGPFAQNGTHGFVPADEEFQPVDLEISAHEATHDSEEEVDLNVRLFTLLRI